MRKVILKLSTFFIVSILLTGILTIYTSSSTLSYSNAIIIGLDDTFVPMGFKDENGTIVGFDVDLATEAFTRMDYEPVFQPIDWSMKETELNSNNIDVIWNGYTITDERQEKVSFTTPYLSNKQIIVTLNDSNINSKSDLKGTHVAVQNGSSSLDALNNYPNLVASFQGGAPILFDTNNEAFMDLEAGRSDALVVDEILARYYIQKRGESNFKVLKDNFGEEEYGIGLRKDDSEILSELNKTLEEMKLDGTTSNISQKWFGEDITN